MCPRVESNHDLFLRREVSYPLNYEDEYVVSDVSPARTYRSVRAGIRYTLPTGRQGRALGFPILLKDQVKSKNSFRSFSLCARQPAYGRQGIGLEFIRRGGTFSTATRRSLPPAGRYPLSPD